LKKRIVLLIIIGIFITGCSKKPDQLSYDEIKDLPLDEQVDSIIKNTELVEEYEVVIDDKSVAIVYPTDKVSDSTIVLSDKDESFPNVAMTFVEHLKTLDLEEIVITSYKTSDSEIAGLTRVSALFTKESIEELDFEEWESEIEDYQHRFYRYSDAYIIIGNVWEKLSDETQDAIGNESKRSSSEFWDYYGSYVE